MRLAAAPRTQLTSGPIRRVCPTQRFGGVSLLRRPTAQMRLRVPKAENITRLRPYGRASKKMGKTPQRQGTYPLYRVPQPLRQMRHALAGDVQCARRRVEALC